MEGVQRTVEFENDRVRIVRYRLGPHVRLPIHNAPDLVAVWLIDSHMRFTFADGTTSDERHKAGETDWRSAQRHAGENLADLPTEFVAIQLK